MSYVSDQTLVTVMLILALLAGFLIGVSGRNKDGD